MFSGDTPLVAFTVSDQEHRAYNPDQRIEFHTVITNEGAGYKPGQHEFVCPVSGMYQFSYSTIGVWGSYSISSIWIENTLLVTSYAVGSENPSASNSVLVHCSSGIKVYVQCGSSFACYPAGTYENYHTFSGFLVSADVTL